jgi:hypothetical protein
MLSIKISLNVGVLYYKSVRICQITKIFSFLNSNSKSICLTRNLELWLDLG